MKLYRIRFTYRGMIHVCSCQAADPDEAMNRVRDCYPYGENFELESVEG